MSKLGKTLIVAATAAAASLPAGAASANPCKGQAPGPHCRPPCTFDVVVDPGDPEGGIAPSVTIGPSGC